MRRTSLLILFCLSSTALLSQFAIGHSTITFNDPLRTGGYGSGGGSGRQIQTEVYYPATVSGENTAVATGSFPVIVFGHGFAMSWDAYANMWEHLVPQGYIVVFPRTEGSLIPAPSHEDFALDLNVVDTRMQLLNTDLSSAFYGKVTDRSAIMGHSMGGGATFLAGAMNTSVRTIIGFAPAETNPSAITAAGSVSVPALIFSGSSDGVTPPDQHHEPIYTALGSSCKSFVSLLGGAHCYFANSNFNCDFGESTSSTGISITRATQQQLTFSFLDLWLAYYLKADCPQLAVFIDLLDDNPSAVAGQTSCVANPVPVITNNSNVLSSSESGVAYQWYIGGVPVSGETAITCPVSASGSYTVEVWYPDGCTQVSAPYEATLSLIEAGKTAVTIHPNPANDVLYITGVLGEEQYYHLYNIAGRQLATGEIGTEISIASLSSGTYFIQLGSKRYRFVKQ